MATAKKKPAAKAAPAPQPTGPRILQVRQGSPEWLAERANRIGGSDANVLMDASPYLTPFQLWQIKLGKRPKPEGWAMGRGHLLEPIIMERYQAVSGHLVDPVVMVAANDWQITSLDGRTIDGDRVVEAKNLDRENFELLRDQRILPAKYVPQVIHNLGVSGAAVLDFVAYNEALDEFEILEVSPDTAYFAKLTAAEAEFRDCLLTQLPPAMVDRDVVERDDPVWIAKALEWERAKVKVEEAEASLEKLREDMIVLAGEQNSRGGGVIVTFASRKGNVNWQSLAKAYSIPVEVQDAARAKRTAYTVVQREKKGEAKL